MTSFVPADYRLKSTRIDTTRDTETLHGWLTHPKARFWDMLDASVDDVATMIDENCAAAGDSVYGMRIGYCDDRPEFLFELYDPTTSELAEPGTGYVHADGDVGMHLLVAHSEQRKPGFTEAVMRHIMRAAFDEAGAQRVVVEPDVRNDAVHRLNAAVGFRVAGDYPVGNKTARLSYCARADFMSGQRA
ncbi:GNAT family N-acetyltransferase [Gordonia sp. NPDC003429]